MTRICRQNWLAAWPICFLTPNMFNRSPLDCATDDRVWEYARINDFAIVTKDEDYNNLSVVRGTPPKVIWLQLGNCTTAQVEQLFRAHISEIETFNNNNAVGTLVLK